MGLSWQQGPLSHGAVGRLLVPEPMPKRLLYAEPLRRRMRVRFGGTWIARRHRSVRADRRGGICSYYDTGDALSAAWSYREAYPEVGRISDLVSFEPDILSVQLDNTQLHLEPGQKVFLHGPDRDLDAHAVTDKQP